MRNYFCVRKSVYKNKIRIFSWNHINFLHVFLLLTLVLCPCKGLRSRGDMFTKDFTSSVSSSSGDSELVAVESNPIVILEVTESNPRNKTISTTNIPINPTEEVETKPETISNSLGTESSISDPIENAIIPEPDYESPPFTSSMPDVVRYPLVEESDEADDAQEREDVAVDNEMDSSSSYEDEVTSKSITVEGSYEELESEIFAAVTPIASYFTQTSEPKSMLSSPTPLVKIKGIVTSTSTAQRNRIKYPLLKKVPSRLVTVANNKIKPAMMKQPQKEVRSTTTKRPVKERPTKLSRPSTPFPHHHNPHHPHGVVVFDKRKKRPKPHRYTAKTTTTTTTTTSSTTTTTTPTPLVDTEDYYDYEWGSGESSESGEGLLGSNSTTNSTSTKKRKKLPLSKLAMAMIASSTVFDNSTGSGEAMFYPKTPVNLLNILQSYTKQLQVAKGEATVKQPMVQIQSSPFMLQLSQLNFGTRVAISIYYSLIAIIPLVYLAFGGLGRLGFLNAIAGRGFVRRRRKRRSFGGNQFYYGGNDGYRTTIIQRTDLDNGKEDEYAWILGRISEIILEFSLMPDDDEIQK